MKYLALFAALTMGAAAHSTVLTCNDGSNLIGLFYYGDRVTQEVTSYGSCLLTGGATPNVSVSIRNLDGRDGSPNFGSMHPWLGTGYGDLHRAMYHSLNGHGEIALVADPGTTVTLQSFDLAGYLGNQTGDYLDVLSDGGTILSESSHVAPGTGRRTVSVNATGQWIKIRFGSNWNVGINNIQFISSESTGHVVVECNMGFVSWQYADQMEGYMEFLNPSTMDVVGSVPTWTSRNGWVAGKWQGLVPAGTYLVRVKPGNWLSKVIGPVTLSGTDNARMEATDFIGGDIDGDNEVGPGDFSMLAMAFLSANGDPNWNTRADLDFDKEIGPGDFSVLAYNFLLGGE